MKITGTATLDAPLERVWEAINDPAVLARCIPGCESLTTLAEDRYAMTVTVGVAAIRGTYDGKVQISDKQAPAALTMTASGAGAAGTIDAAVLVALAASPTGGTDISYDADATVGGAVGGVGQRMLGSVTKKLAGQFFTALDRDIAGVRPGAMAAGPAAADAAAAQA
ncbi:MAG: carbon monoxide dehydrogenase subunit G, partial [Nocardioides sp.]